MQSSLCVAQGLRDRQRLRARSPSFDAAQTDKVPLGAGIALAAGISLRVQIGIVNQNRERPCGERSNPILPPCASTTDRQIASPKPSPPCFVVKKGSKMLGSFSGS